MKVVDEDDDILPDKTLVKKPAIEVPSFSFSAAMAKPLFAAKVVAMKSPVPPPAPAPTVPVATQVNDASTSQKSKWPMSLNRWV